METKDIPDIGARQMAAILAVAEYRSFIAAASALGTSQPALTRAVKRVEETLGVRLFDRSTRTVSVTDAGQEFIQVARRITNDLRISVDSIREVADQKRGHVTISSVMSLANGALPQAIAAYRKDHPFIDIDVRDGIYGSVNADVRSGAADFGLNYLHDVPDAFVTTRLGTGRFDLIASTTHPLAKSRKKKIKFRDLEALALVSMPHEAQTRRVLDANAAAYGVRLNHAVVVSQITTLLAFVRADAGVGLVPSAAVEGSLGEGLVRLAVTDPAISLHIGLVRLRDKVLSPAAEGLLSAEKKCGIPINA